MKTSTEQEQPATPQNQSPAVLTWRNFKHLIVACGLWALAYFGLIQPVHWVSNLFGFITWFSLCAYLMMFFNKETRELQLQSYRDGKHAPRWFDQLTYSALILMCAAMGEYFKAVVWVICGVIDLTQRDNALSTKGDTKS